MNIRTATLLVLDFQGGF